MADVEAGPLRADARRNRARILEVARSVFDDSSESTLQSVAKRAGVGQGTLYRHFPSREALLIEVYRDEYAALLASAERLHRDAPGVSALREWLSDLATLGRMKHALVQALDAATRDQLHEDQRRPLLAIIDLLLDDGRVAGEVREDVTSTDLLTLVSFLWHVPLQESQAGHLLDLVVAGLAPGRSDDSA